MSTELTLATVLGTDGVAPVYNPTGRWEQWNINEIYLGGPGAGKYVPKVGDVVYTVTGQAISRQIVVSINEVTLVPVLIDEDISRITQSLTEFDILFGVGPGTQSDTYRCYLDKSVQPYRLTVDARLTVAGSMCAYAKIFKGADVSAATGVVIAGVYNQSGVITSENIPLELVARNTLENYAIKAVSSCHTVQDLPDGELITVVLYRADGIEVSKRQMLIENTAFVRSLDASMRHVVGISVETPFLSASVGDQIDYPLNVALNAINLMGVVNYSDGSSVRMAVDGTRFAVQGLEAYAATIVGQTTQLVLKYKLASNEIAYGPYLGQEGHIAQPIEIRTVNVVGSYSVQLFAYPVWIDAVSGYRLEWFLYDLDRSISYNVTPYVTIYTSTRVYDPKLYGVKQTLQVGVNLRQVNGSYKNFTHVQFIDIQLNKVGSERPLIDNAPNWQVASVAGTTLMFGQGCWATYYRPTSNVYQVKVKGAATTQAEWLTNNYVRTNPLVNGFSETVAPTPTHFQLIVGDLVQEHAVSEWDQTFQFSQGPVNNGTSFLKFIYRTSEGDLYLAAAGLPTYQVDVSGNYT